MNLNLGKNCLATLAVALLATSSTRCVFAASTPPTKTASNAYDFYLRAGKALNSDFMAREFPYFNDAKANAQFGSPWKRREAVLSRNARALSLMRQGFSFPYSRKLYTSQWDLASNDDFSFFAHTRQFARLLSVESEVFAHRGEYSKAINSSLDAMRLSKDVSRGGGLIDLLVGNAISQIGQSRIKKSIINKLNATEAKAAARRLENIEMRNGSYADVMREEKRFGNLMLRETLKDDSWRKEYPTTKTPRQITIDFNRLMDGVIINAARPFPQRKAKLEAADDELNKTMTDIFTEGTAATGWFQARDHTTSQMLIASLALRAYRVERGAFPSSLDQLVPNYLRRVPLDSYSNKPLRYVKKNIEYSLYSVGPDFKDDGGAPIKARPNRPYQIAPEAKGDIVLGINTR